MASVYDDFAAAQQQFKRLVETSTAIVEGEENETVTLADGTQINTFRESLRQLGLAADAVLADVNDTADSVYQQAQQVATFVDQAQAALRDTTADANRAELARDAGLATGKMFPTVALGVSGTTAPDYFSVEPASDASTFSVYKNVDDTEASALEVAALPTALLIRSQDRGTFLNPGPPRTFTHFFSTVIYPQRVQARQNSASAAAVVWDLDRDYAAGERVAVYTRGINAGAASVGLYLWDGSNRDSTTPVVLELGGNWQRHLMQVTQSGVDGVGVLTNESDSNFELELFALPADAPDMAPIVDIRGRLYDVQVTLESGAPKASLSGFLGRANVFDVRDGLRAPGGYVSSWLSNRDLSLAQNDPAFQPVVAPRGIDFGDAASWLEHGHEPGVAKLISAQHLPASAVAANPSGGFTCTGLARAANGYWILGNDGRTDENDSSFSPSIVVLDPGRTTIIDEFPMSGVYADIESIQGVAYDSSDDTIWFVDKMNSMIRHIEMDGTPILSDEFNPGYVPNGLAYDAIRDALWVCRDGNSTFAAHSCADGSILKSFAAWSERDQLFHDSANDYLFATYGNNGENGLVEAWDCKLGNLIARWENLAIAQAIEGVHYDQDSGVVTISNDGGFHTVAQPPLSMTLQYQIPMPAPAYNPRTVVISALLQRPNTQPGSTALISAYNVSDTRGGWGIFFPGGANSLRVMQRDNGDGSARSITWPIDCVADEVLVSFVLTSGAAPVCYANGVEVSASAVSGDFTQMASVFGLGRFVLGAGLDYSGDPLFASNVTVAGLIYTDDLADRVVAEGWLAHRQKRTDLLPAGHQYKAVAP